MAKTSRLLVKLVTVQLNQKSRESYRKYMRYPVPSPQCYIIPVVKQVDYKDNWQLRAMVGLLRRMDILGIAPRTIGQMFPFGTLSTWEPGQITKRI